MVQKLRPRKVLECEIGLHHLLQGGFLIEVLNKVEEKKFVEKIFRLQLLGKLVILEKALLASLASYESFC